MKEITNLMINEFKIMKLGYDFMGFKVDKKSSLSFHHLIIPHRESKAKGIGEGYLRWNGAILVQSTSHDYLHTIERYDYETFTKINSEMIDENIKGEIDIYNLIKIRELLEEFERKYGNYTNKKGRKLIKNEYYNRIDLKEI